MFTHGGTKAFSAAFKRSPDITSALIFHAADTVKVCGSEEMPAALKVRSCRSEHMQADISA
jgi:hypothetical protein